MSGGTQAAPSATPAKKTYSKSQIVKMILGGLFAGVILLFIFKYVLSSEKTTWTNTSTKQSTEETEVKKEIVTGKEYDLRNLTVGQTDTIPVPAWTEVTIRQNIDHNLICSTDGLLDGIATCTGGKFKISIRIPTEHADLCERYTFTNNSKHSCSLMITRN